MQIIILIMFICQTRFNTDFFLERYSRLIKYVVCVNVYVLVEYNGCLYIFGGYNGLQDTHYSDLYKFDPGKALALSLPPKLWIFQRLSAVCRDSALSSLQRLSALFFSPSQQLFHSQNLQAGEATSSTRCMQLTVSHRGLHGWDFSSYSQISGLRLLLESNKSGVEMHFECSFSPFRV